MRYIKQHLTTMDGVEIFPIIAFLLFFVFFIAFIISVYRMDKKKVNHIENLPLNDGGVKEKISLLSKDGDIDRIGQIK